MPNVYQGTGNLGDNPTLKTVTVKGEDRKVASFRVYFDEYKPVQDTGEIKQSGGFWMTVDAWGRQADQAAEHLRKGCRVNVIGRIVEDEWEDKESGAERTAHRLVAEGIFLSLSRIESVKFRPPKGEARDE